MSFLFQILGVAGAAVQLVEHVYAAVFHDREYSRADQQLQLDPIKLRKDVEGFFQKRDEFINIRDHVLENVPPPHQNISDSPLVLDAACQPEMIDTFHSLFDESTSIADDVARAFEKIATAQEEFRILNNSKQTSPHYRNVEAAMLHVFGFRIQNELFRRLIVYRPRASEEILGFLNKNRNSYPEFFNDIESITDTDENVLREIVELITVNSARNSRATAAFAALSDSSIRFCTPSVESLDLHTGLPLSSSQYLLIMRSGRNSPTRPHKEAYTAFTDPCRELTEVSEEVLKSLFFEQMSDRYEEVAAAHPTAYNWIFDTTKKNTLGTSFGEWLEKGRGCYLLQGKAGSGKSTCCKYILGHARTRKALETWAGDHKLIICSFFFWRLGSELQQSLAGLLRSLLGDLLQDHIQTLPTVFPALVKDLLRGKKNRSFSLVELKDAFEKYIELCANTQRICLFIDGLDECNEDHAVISEYLMDVASVPQVKILITSRPLPAVLDVLSQCPGLRLQDLTQDGIKDYALSELRKSRRFQQFEQDERHKAKQLINEISRRASGVFLWVVLVVASLRQGLRDFDSFEDLKARLEELPTELSDLFKHMLSSISVRHQLEAYRMISIILRSTAIQEEGSLTAAQLWLAEQSTTDQRLLILADPRQYMCKPRLLEEIEGRVRSRCCGLVEVYSHVTEPSERNSSEATVTFLHRTVGEFFSEPAVRERFEKALRDTQFDTNLALAFSMTCDVISRDVTSSAARSLLAEYCLQYSQDVRVQSSPDLVVIVSHLDNAMQNPSTEYWGWKYIRTSYVLPFKLVATEQSCGTIVLAAQLGIEDYVRHRLEEEVGFLQLVHRPALLSTLICSLFMTSNFPHPDFPGNRLLWKDVNYSTTLLAATLLLEAGLDVNRQLSRKRDVKLIHEQNWFAGDWHFQDIKHDVGTWRRLPTKCLTPEFIDSMHERLPNCSAWISFLAYLSQLRPCFDEVPHHLQDQALDLLKLFQLFIGTGADVHARVPSGQWDVSAVGPVSDTKTGLGVLLGLLSRSAQHQQGKLLSAYQKTLLNLIAENLETLLKGGTTASASEAMEIADIMRLIEYNCEPAILRTINGNQGYLGVVNSGFASRETPHLSFPSATRHSPYDEYV